MKTANLVFYLTFTGEHFDSSSGEQKCRELKSLLSQDQCTFIIFQYGKLEKVAVRRAFRKQFYSTNPKAVPKNTAFFRLINKFTDTGDIHSASKKKEMK